MGNSEERKYNLVFYRSKEMPDYYLLFCGGRNPQEMLQTLNHVGKYENSGYPHADVDFGYLLTYHNDTQELLNFITEHIATRYIPHPKYDWVVCKGWYELKTYEPEKWLKDFEDYKNAKKEVYRQKTQEVVRQLTLF